MTGEQDLNTHQYSRRDFLKMSVNSLWKGALVAGTVYLTSACGVPLDQAKQITNESKRYKPLDTAKSKNVNFLPEVENDNRIGAGRVRFAEGGGMYYLNKENQYQELGVFGSIVPEGDPNDRDSWHKIKEKGLEATELFSIWNSPDGTIENQSRDDFQPALDYAIAEGVQVMPMVNYSISDIITNVQGEKEYRFSEARLRKLMDKAGNNILGFQFDEPVEGVIVGGTEGAKFDYLQFIKDYSKLCALPLRIINSGAVYKNVAEYAEYHQAMIQQCIDNNVKVITGSDYYPHMAMTVEATKDGYSFDLTQMIEQQQLWSQEAQKENGGVASWATLAGHDGWPPKEASEDVLKSEDVLENVFEKMDLIGSLLPFPPNQELSGFAKLQIWQIITASALNPKYAHFDWWTWPAGELTSIGINKPFEKSGAGISQAINCLHSAIPYINGKLVGTGNTGGCDYSIKEIIAEDGNSYQAIFVHVNKKDGFPDMVLKPGDYVDLISGITYHTGYSWGANKLNSIGMKLPTETVMCLVPAQQKST